MTEREVQQEIRQFIVDTFLFGDETAAPSPESSLLESGLVDSTGVLDLAAFLEQRFGIVAQDEELAAENFDSIERIARFVVKKKAR